MKQSMQLRLGQSLTMTPQLQQAIRLLQLSTMELQAEVQEALDSNMMLEAADEADDSAESERSGGETASLSSESGNGKESGDSGEGAMSETDIPTELPVDSAWEDIYDAPVATTYRSAPELNGADFESHRSAAETLQDRLMWQINLTPFNQTDLVIAMAIVDALGKDGYLSCSLQEIIDSLSHDEEVELDPQDVETVLRRIQLMDPAGVAARDLQECLQIQLAQLDDNTQWVSEARQLVKEHLNLLGARDYNQLMRRMKLSKDELQHVIHLIQSMNPRPGSVLDSEAIEYVVPDVFVRKVKDRWHVELNQEAIPQLRINSRYAGMVRRADSSPDNVSMKAHLQEARWFIKSLQSRSETLLRVATAIVERQQAFLDYGEEAMKPRVLHDIAGALGMHESTISRVTTRKYMHTPRGIYELKYFFSSHVSTTRGGEASSTAIRAVIKKLIAAEDSTKPLSDSKIAAILKEQGIQVARRTIAKYREAMNIPPSNERKSLS
jgi:RNA polymerase sigma-54 factor